MKTLILFLFLFYSGSLFAFSCSNILASSYEIEFGEIVYPENELYSEGVVLSVDRSTGIVLVRGFIKSDLVDKEFKFNELALESIVSVYGFQKGDIVYPEAEIMDVGRVVAVHPVNGRVFVSGIKLGANQEAFVESFLPSELGYEKGISEKGFNRGDSVSISAIGTQLGVVVAINPVNGRITTLSNALGVKHWNPEDLKVN